MQARAQASELTRHEVQQLVAPDFHGELEGCGLGGRAKPQQVNGVDLGQGGAGCRAGGWGGCGQKAASHTRCTAADARSALAR